MSPCPDVCWNTHCWALGGAHLTMRLEALPERLRCERLHDAPSPGRACRSPLPPSLPEGPRDIGSLHSRAALAVTTTRPTSLRSLNPCGLRHRHVPTAPTTPYRDMRSSVTSRVSVCMLPTTIPIYSTSSASNDKDALSQHSTEKDVQCTGETSDDSMWTTQLSALQVQETRPDIPVSTLETPASWVSLKQRMRYVCRKPI